jgi:hypothetical protein
MMGQAEFLPEGLMLLQTAFLLLRKHSAAQKDFEGAGGYPQVLEMLERLVLRSAPGDDVDGFVGEAVGLLLALAVDGPPCLGARVANWAALKAILSLVSASEDLGMALRGVRALTDLLALHPINMVSLEHVGGVSAMVDVLAHPLLEDAFDRQGAGTGPRGAAGEGPVCNPWATGAPAMGGVLPSTFHSRSAAIR